MLVAIYSSPKQTAVQQLSTWCHLNFFWKWLNTTLSCKTQTLSFTERWTEESRKKLIKKKIRFSEICGSDESGCSVERSGAWLHAEVPEGDSSLFWWVHSGAREQNRKKTVCSVEEMMLTSSIIFESHFNTNWSLEVAWHLGGIHKLWPEIFWRNCTVCFFVKLC